MLSLASLQPFEFRRRYKPCVGSKGAGCAPGGKRVASACGRDVGPASARAGPRARACRTQVCCGCRPKNSKEAATSATVGPLKRWRPGCRPKVGPLTRAGAKKARFWRRPCSCCRGLASSLRIRSQTGSRFCDLPPTWLWRPWRRRCRWRRRRHACASSAGGTSPTMHQADVLLWPGLGRAAFVRACFQGPEAGTVLLLQGLLLQSHEVWGSSWAPTHETFYHQLAADHAHTVAVWWRSYAGEVQCLH